MRANRQASDFALLELTSRPSHTNLSFLGWSRNMAGITNTAGIHHPRGDLMKISIDQGAPIQRGTNLVIEGLTYPVGNIWEVDFDIGTVEGGSSGSPLLDQNRRVIGQLLGATINPTLPHLGRCQIRNGFYGRFDVSWGRDTAGNFLLGRNATNSLAPWLDPNNTGNMTTNTISMASLTGPATLCTSDTYTLTNLPTGATITGWSASPSSAVTLSGSGNSRTVTRVGNASGPVNIQATISTPCGTSLQVHQDIWVGPPHMPVALDGEWMPLIALNGCTNVHYDIMMQVDARQGVIEWEWTHTGNFNLINVFGPTRRQVLGFVAASGGVTVKARNDCGWSLPRYIPVNIIECGMGFSVYPNPASETLTVSIGSEAERTAVPDKSSLHSFSAVLYDTQGRQIRQGESKDGAVQLDTRQLPEGTYFLHIHHDGQVEKRQVVIKH